MTQTPKMPPTETYRCENCGKEFPKGWSDEEAAVERKQNWGNIPPEECSIVCDDCYKKFMEWFNQQYPPG